MYGLLLSTANLTGIYVRDYVYNQLEFFGQITWKVSWKRFP